MNTRSTIILLALLAFAPLVQAGPIAIYTSQTRETEAQAEAFGGTPDSQSDMAVNFDPWESLVEASSVEPFTSSYADAYQISTLGPGAIVASGSAAVANTGPGTSDARSFMEITFLLNETLPYDLSSTISLEGAAPPSVGNVSRVFVQLEGPSGNVFLDQLTSDGVSDLNLQGNLDPGEYTFSATADIGLIDLGAARGTFSVDLVVPEPITATLLTLGMFFVLPRRRSNAIRN